ncbi:MAG TPA: hypothetical protein VN772_05050 [Solirubrobacteraceae bacterium]|nr:hypothetical protein [Solirubrobacteraceae bacterium]
MPRIIVTTEPVKDDAPVTLDESVAAIHISDEHASSQLMERLGWAVEDAERVEEQARA